MVLQRYFESVGYGKRHCWALKRERRLRQSAGRACRRRACAGCCCTAGGHAGTSTSWNALAEEGTLAGTALKIGWRPLSNSKMQFRLQLQYCS